MSRFGFKTEEQSFARQRGWTSRRLVMAATTTTATAAVAGAVPPTSSLSLGSSLQESQEMWSLECGVPAPWLTQVTCLPGTRVQLSMATWRMTEASGHHWPQSTLHSWECHHPVLLILRALHHQLLDPNTSLLHLLPALVTIPLPPATPPTNQTPSALLSPHSWALDHTISSTPSPRVQLSRSFESPTKSWSRWYQHSSM